MIYTIYVSTTTPVVFLSSCEVTTWHSTLEEAQWAMVQDVRDHGYTWFVIRYT